MCIRDSHIYMKTNLLNNIAKGEFSMAQIADVIKYEGDNTTFIWKSPLEDFHSMTHLIVHESQEAIFFMNGQALDPVSYTHLNCWNYYRSVQAQQECKI